MAKNIILCCDGTSNQFSGNQTNVLRLFRAAVGVPGKQVTYYDPGVGTMPAPGQLTKFGKKVTVLLGLAIGFGFTKNISDTYTFLMGHYEPGDNVFLFGFSRGAYTARAVAGMLHAVGLLRTGTENLIPYAIRYWRNSFTKEGAQVAADFKRTMARECKPHFVGVWDTVGAVGWINNFQTFPYTYRNPDVAIFRHAVSIDEKRCCFRSNLFAPEPPTQNVKNVWFAGVHSDVGGGYPEAESGLAKIPFGWIAKEAYVAGMLIDDTVLQILLGAKTDASGNVHCKPDPGAAIHESLTGFWWILEGLPRKHWNAQSKTFHWTWRPAEPRSIAENSILHVSVTERQKTVSSYQPPNLPNAYQIEA